MNFKRQVLSWFTMLAVQNFGSVCLAQDFLDLIDNTKPPPPSTEELTVWENGAYKLQHLNKDTIYGHMGLKDGDIIKKWNGRVIKQPEDLKYIIQSIRRYDDLTAVVDRNGKEMTFQVKAGSDKKGYLDPPTKVNNSQGPFGKPKPTKHPGS